jgi:hypothetical protein
MAKIWLLDESAPPKGTVAADKSLQWCVDELGLHRDLWVGSQGEPLLLGWIAHLGMNKGKYAVAEVEEGETAAPPVKGWRSGYYLLAIGAAAVKRRLRGEVDWNPDSESDSSRSRNPERQAEKGGLKKSSP